MSNRWSFVGAVSVSRGYLQKFDQLVHLVVFVSAVLFCILCTVYCLFSCIPPTIVAEHLSLVSIGDRNRTAT